MKLWPFSKKTDESAAAKSMNPNSRKMELPQGVTLAASPEPTTPSATLPANEPSLPSATFSLESLASEPSLPYPEGFNPIPPATPEAASTTAPAKPDLTSFFEQNNLAFISPHNTQTDTTTLATEEPAVTTFDTDTTNFSAESLGLSLPEIPTPDLFTPSNNAPEANATTPFPEPFNDIQTEQPNLSTFEFFPPELQEPNATILSSDTDFFTVTQPTITDETVTIPTDLFPEYSPESTTTQTEPATPQPETLDSSAVTPSLTESYFVPNPDTPLDTPFTQNSDDSFFLYTTSDEPEIQTANGLFGFSPDEDTNLTDFQSEIEAAFLPQPNTELPPPLNLPDEALIPNGNESFFEAAAMHNPFEPADFNDEPFDLDSLLLAQSNSLEATTYVMGDSTTEASCEPEAYNPAPVENLSTSETSYETVDADTNHYFGDEADGLKGADNPDSYDLGHYEDPDEPATAFVLDDTSDEQAPLEACATGVGEYAEQAAPQFEPDVEETSKSTSIATESTSYLHMASLPSPEDFLQGVTQPGNFEGTLTNSLPNELSNNEESTPIPNEPETQDISSTPQSESENPEPTANSEEAPPPKTKPVINRSQIQDAKKLKPYQASLTDYIGSFEQEVMLKNSQFIRHSINDLVDSYFAIQDQEAS